MRTLLVLLCLLLTACGIQPSRVIPGAPAPRIKAGGTVLYFIHDGALTPITLPESLRPDAALNTLAQGPTLPGYTSEVPPSIAPAGFTADGLTLAHDPAGLSTTAIDQIVCTVGTGSRVVGLTQRTCPLH